MQITLFTANCVGNKKNCLYPNKCVIDNEIDFMAAIEKDHVAVEYRKSYRSIENFIGADCLVMDNDNDHSDDPEDWIGMREFAEALPDVSLIIAPSRHHLKEKDGKSARERYHVYFPIRTMQDADSYKELKRLIQERFPIFDDNALDAARFIFGAPQSEIIWQEGSMTIDQVLEPSDDDVIPIGRRNSTLSRYAGRVLKRFGDTTDKAYQMFKEKADKCDPPLDDDELSTIWNSACKFYKKVSRQAGYVAPADYEFSSLKPDDYSDIGQAEVVAREYGDEVKYSSATDLIRYDGIS